MINSKWVKIINIDSKFYLMEGEVRPSDLVAACNNLSVMIEVFIPDFAPVRFSRPEFDILER